VPAAKTDAFPLSPDYGYTVSHLDRKVRFATEDGGIWTRNKGTDRRVFELRGTCSPAEATSLQTFYEDHAIVGCTVQDKTKSPQEDSVCKFTRPCTFTPVMHGIYQWEAFLQQVE